MEILNLAILRGVAVPLPPFEEQGEIVRRVDQFLTLANALDRRLSAASQRVDRSSQAVLAKAFRGDLSEMATAVESLSFNPHITEST